MTHFIFLQSLKLRSSITNKIVQSAQRLIPLSNIKWIEYNESKNAINIAYNDSSIDTYIAHEKKDKDLPKKVFNDIVSDIRIKNSVIDWKSI